MKKLIIVPLLLMCFSLSACDDEQVKIEVTRYRVVDIPPALYNSCPDVGKIPRSDTLTDEEVGIFILKLYKNNLKCRQAIIAIHNYLNEAHKTIDNKPIELHSKF